MINSNLFITGIHTLAEYFNARKNMMDDTAATSVMMGQGPHDAAGQEVEDPIFSIN